MTTGYSKLTWYFMLVWKTDHYLGNIDWHANLVWHGNSDWDDNKGRHGKWNYKIVKVDTQGWHFLIYPNSFVYTVPFDPTLLQCVKNVSQLGGKIKCCLLMDSWIFLLWKCLFAVLWRQLHTNSCTYEKLHKGLSNRKRSGRRYFLLFFVYLHHTT